LFEQRHMYEIASPAFALRTGAARLTFINDVYQGTRCYSFPHPRYAALLVSTPGIPRVCPACCRADGRAENADGYKTAPITNPDAASASPSCYLPNRNSRPQACPKQTVCLSTNRDLLLSRPLLRVHAGSSKHGVAVASSGLCFSDVMARTFARATTLMSSRPGRVPEDAGPARRLDLASPPIHLRPPSNLVPEPFAP
jgi:hypothetical protein